MGQVSNTNHLPQELNANVSSGALTPKKIKPRRLHLVTYALKFVGLERGGVAMSVLPGLNLLFTLR